MELSSPGESPQPNASKLPGHNTGSLGAANATRGASSSSAIEVDSAYSPTLGFLQLNSTQWTPGTSQRSQTTIDSHDIQRPLCYEYV